uniref:ShKT domain-containing protein n=1 Tax=Rhabditophanes sp. KR3021 TaxID=114890 RepID=A0AC35U3S0_9BILA
MFKNLSLLLVLLSCLVNKLILAQNYYRGYVWACPTALRPYLGSGANSYGYWLPDNTGTCQKPPSGTFQNALNACTNGAASLLTVVGGNGGANNIQVCGCCYDNLQDYQNDQVNIVFPTTPGDETLATLLCVNTNAKCYEWATAGRCNDPLFSTFMNNVCPLSCTQCTRTTTCLDRKINCRSYVDYCEVDEYLPIMMFECSRTCGFCIQRTTTVVAPCMDYDGLCPTRYSLCSISTLSTAVQALCPLTCGVCVSNTTTIATPITTKSLPHLIPNIETIVEVCRDYRRDCASFLSLCDMPEHFPW